MGYFILSSYLSRLCNHWIADQQALILYQNTHPAYMSTSQFGCWNFDVMKQLCGMQNNRFLWVEFCSIQKKFLLENNQITSNIYYLIYECD